MSAAPTARVGIYGAGGRMGRALVSAVLEQPALSLGAAVDAPGSPSLGQDAGTLAGTAPLGVLLTQDPAALAKTDVVIDFSTAAATEALLPALTAARVPAVIGTTGLSDSARRALGELARVVPVVQAPNYSIGVAVLNHVLGEAARLLGPDYDAELVEAHHKHKVDAPSGTALRLAETVRAAKGLPADALVTGRAGSAGPRRKEEIGVLALRGGDVVGDHTMFFYGPGERLEFTHRAHDRSLFARGAVRAAAWVRGQAPGIHGMEAVLGLGPRG